MENIHFNKIGIAGLGLIGGSFAKAFVEQGIKVYGFDKSVECLGSAAESFIFEGLTDNEDEFLNFELDLIYICLPVNSALKFLEYLGGKKVTTFITDGCSTKKSICEKAKDLNLNFVGGHPIAGKEVSGFENSEADIFKNAYHILIDSEQKEFLGALKNLHSQIGMKVNVMDVDRHDKIFGLISHFPHLIAFSLIDFVENEDSLAFSFTGGGFRDFTRIAKSNPTMWSDIFFDNSDNLQQLIDRYIEELTKWKNAIKSNDYDLMKSMISKVKGLREAL
ncbi:prephenate dehydrogenase [Deferribacterales bacterium Es71-Z0220]|uniref:prephenate dehydrogenase n=1 Tax=Deferrivibrio essentukiensis TaxID=2880922 RepID=UPI001F6171FE|nr:prephenate dehydrogenase [Deferrivibrio essentukiensis]MCB4203665.1 prephenate dehydrogenase [Deferrivibrio essentukiensis]